MNLQMLDTQIISYAYKGRKEEVTGQSIASVTAKEFLLAQEDERNKVAYYLPVNIQFIMDINENSSLLKLEHPFSKRHTDQIILELGADFPTMIQHGNLAITSIINSKARRLYSECVSFLEKEKRKLLLEKFDFLIDNNISCVPLNRTSAALGIQLFYDFITKFNTKQNIRNTVNDVLILATAVESSATLISQDSVLNRFTAKYFDVAIKDTNNQNICVGFSKPSDSSKDVHQENKGYVNSSWRIITKNYHVKR